MAKKRGTMATVIKHDGRRIIVRRDEDKKLLSLIPEHDTVEKGDRVEVDEIERRVIAVY